MKKWVLLFLVLLATSPANADSDTPVKIVLDPQFIGTDCLPIRSAQREYFQDIGMVIAEKLKAAIEEETDYQVVYTHDRDRYTSLEDRILKANQCKGDVLISIGASCSKDEPEGGFRVYHVAIELSDGEDRLSGEEPHSEQLLKIVEALKADTMDRHEKSRELSELVFGELRQSVFSKDGGPKHAPFDILLGVHMPATMVVVGSVANEGERKRLRDLNHQDEIASSVFRGLRKFIKIQF